MEQAGIGEALTFFLSGVAVGCLATFVRVQRTIDLCLRSLTQASSSASLDQKMIWRDLSDALERFSTTPRTRSRSQGEQNDLNPGQFFGLLNSRSVERHTSTSSQIDSSDSTGLPTPGTSALDPETHNIEKPGHGLRP